MFKLGTLTLTGDHAEETLEVWLAADEHPILAPSVILRLTGPQYIGVLDASNDLHLTFPQARALAALLTDPRIP